MTSFLRPLTIVLPLLLLYAGCGGSVSTVRLNDGVIPGPPVFNSAGIKVFAARAIGRAVEELGSVCVSTQSDGQVQHITRSENGPQRRQQCFAVARKGNDHHFTRHG